MRTYSIYGKKKKSKIWIIVLVVLAVVAVVVLANVVASLYYGGANGEKQVRVNENNIKHELSFELDPGISYEHAVTDNALYFFSAENTKISNSSGELEQDISLPMSNPIVSSRGNFALLADKGGKKAYLFNNSKKERDLTLDESIIIAAVNSGGNSIFVTKGEAHKCSVIVLSRSGEELFKWNSGGLYVVAADISDNNKDIFVSTLNTDNGTLKSNIIMFNITKEKPFANEVYDDMLFSSLLYSGNNLYCISDTAVYIFNGYGKKIGEIDYGDRELLTFCADGDLLVLAFSGNGVSANATVIESYSPKGNKLGEFTLSHGIDFLDCRNGTIAVSNNRTISILNEACVEKFQMSPGIDLRDFQFFGGSNAAVGITATGAVMLNVG